MSDEIKSFSPAGGRIYKEDSSTVNHGDMLEEYLGQKGMVVISDTSSHTPGAGECFIALQTLSDTVLNTLTPDSTSPITGTITGITIGTNVVIYGKFVSVKLTSGSCIAYLGIL